MADSLQQAPTAEASRNGDVEEYDVLIIGAGVTGLYSLYRFRELGFSCKSFEDASGVGGTWYWNRYPGARFDSESYTYGYSFSEELLQEWHWKELYSGQPENERYLNYVADKFDLRRHIRFNSRVESCVYDEDANRWELTMQDGHKARGQFLITAVGLLSAHYVPDFEGIHDFKGPWFHTGPLAQGRHRPGRQARRRGRHRGHSGAAHHRNRQGGRPPDRLPAHRQLLRPAAQPPHHRGRAGGNQGALPGDIREVPGDRRLLHARVRHPLRVQRFRRGAGGVLRIFVAGAGLQEVAQQLLRRDDARPGQRGLRRILPQQDPRAGEGSRWWPRC